MRNAQNRALAGLLAMGLVLAGLAGCKGYDVEVTVAPDGSGTREVELSLDGGLGEDSAELEELARLFRLDPAIGWEQIRRVPVGESSGREKISGFQRRQELSGPEAWRQQSGDITILGTLAEGPAPQVMFRNEVQLVAGAGGGLTYRETFAWSGLKEAIVEFEVQRITAGVAATFSGLTAEERAEVRGIVKGHLALYLVAMVRYEEELPEEDLVASVTEQTLAVVRQRYPEAKGETIAAVLKEKAESGGTKLDEYIAEHLPGAEESVLTEISVRVTMPGEIVETNADEIDGRTAVWRFGVWDALNRPVRLIARTGPTR